MKELRDGGRVDVVGRIGGSDVEDVGAVGRGGCGGEAAEAASGCEGAGVDLAFEARADLAVEKPKVGVGVVGRARGAGVDVVMIANLLIMVIIGGYETFVSRIKLKNHPDQPEWLSHVNANVLKVKLAMAIVGISSIHLLQTFINAARTAAEASCRPRPRPCSGWPGRRRRIRSHRPRQ